MGSFAKGVVSLFAVFSLAVPLPVDTESPKNLSPTSAASSAFQVVQNLKKISSNLHPLLGLPAVKLLNQVELAGNDLTQLKPGFWQAYRKLLAEWERLEKAPSGWIFDQYPELKETDGQGTVLSITADLMLEHPELIGLGTGGLGVLKRDDTFAFGEAFGIENYFLVAPFYSERSNQELEEDGKQVWKFKPVDKSKVPAEELGIIKVPYGFDIDEAMDDPEKLPAFLEKMSRKVANGELPPTSRFIYIKVWKLKMGKGNLLLLDTDIEENDRNDRYLNNEVASKQYEWLESLGYDRKTLNDRKIMSRIYPKDRSGEDSQRQRFKQFVLLSLGSFKAFQLANKERGIRRPTFLHLNDPHVAPAAAKVLADPFYKNVLTVYTNHTLVKGAGTQWFQPDNKRYNRENPWFLPIRYLPYSSNPVIANVFHHDQSVEFSDAAEDLVSRKIEFGRINAVNSDEHAVKLAQNKPQLYQNSDGSLKGNLVGVDNGVDMNWAPEPFRFQWEGRTPDQIQEKLTAFMDALDDETIEKVKKEGKRELARFIQEKYNQSIDPAKMVVTFAKRINAYKRPEMILQVVDQIEQALAKAPKDEIIQLIFSGKANDNDDDGIRLIKEIVSAQEKYKGRVRVLYLPDYHIEVAQKLLLGSDFWLNTPRRHMEASGTSLLKAALNGTILISTQSGAALHKEFFQNAGPALIENRPLNGDENALLVDVGKELYEVNPEHKGVENIEKVQLVNLMEQAHNLFYRPKRKQNFRLMRRNGIAKFYEMSSLRQVVDQINKTFLPLFFERDFEQKVLEIRAVPAPIGGMQFEVDVKLGLLPPKDIRLGIWYSDESMDPEASWEDHTLKRFEANGEPGVVTFKGLVPMQRGKARYVIYIDSKKEAAINNKVFDRDPWVQKYRRRKWFFQPGNSIETPQVGEYNEAYVDRSFDPVEKALWMRSSI